MVLRGIGLSRGTVRLLRRIALLWRRILTVAWLWGICKFGQPRHPGVRHGTHGLVEERRMGAADDRLDCMPSSIRICDSVCVSQSMMNRSVNKRATKL